MAARVAKLDEIDPIAVAGVNWHPVRRTLGVGAFGINAYSANAGEHLIEEHDEVDGDEEVYLVLRGRATFTVAGEEIDAPALTAVFLPDRADRRGAVATEDGTLALAVGGTPAAHLPVSAWEHRFAGYGEKDPDRAYDVAAKAFDDHPDDPQVHYDLACFAAVGGKGDLAIDHLTKAIAGDRRAADWAADDKDLDALRDHPDWPL